MITVIVHIKMPAPMTLEKAREVFTSTAPKYRDVPGLIREKYGVDPELTYFESPVVVDNLTAEIIAA